MSMEELMKRLGKGFSSISKRWELRKMATAFTELSIQPWDTMKINLPIWDKKWQNGLFYIDPMKCGSNII